jgi:hypothetical protein
VSAPRAADGVETQILAAPEKAGRVWGICQSARIALGGDSSEQTIREILTLLLDEVESVRAWSTADVEARRAG